MPEEVVVKTTAWRFHMGARADETWPLHAEETYEQLGKVSSLLFEEEDVLVPLLSTELGLIWPRDGLDFDVVYYPIARDTACAGSLPSRIELDKDSVEPARFLACVLRRSYGRLERESTLAQAIEGVRQAMSPPERSRIEGLYTCIATYAVSAAMVVRVPEQARALEAPLTLRCAKPQLEWVAQHWLVHARGEESAEAFGARAARGVGVEAMGSD